MKEVTVEKKTMQAIEERIAWRLTKKEIKQLDDWFAKIIKAHQIPIVYLPKLIADTSKGIVWVGEPYK